MKWLLAALIPGGVVALVVWELVQRRRHRHADYVSEGWLRAAGQRETRIEFVSVSWTWPVDKSAA